MIKEISLQNCNNTINANSYDLVHNRIHSNAKIIISTSLAVIFCLLLVTKYGGSVHEISLIEKEIHDLHAANTLKDVMNKGPDPSVAEYDNAGDDIHLRGRDEAMTSLDEARKEAEQRVRLLAARHKMDVTQSEELDLKRQLDDETRFDREILNFISTMNNSHHREKQREDLKGRMSRRQARNSLSVSGSMSSIHDRFPWHSESVSIPRTPMPDQSL